ncbi:hypothetical protein [Streptomyces sp. NBC_00859]|uniref:hypothetical protein n=1 Tax=Streptomyces sp. NBC_00859 TaxID=2903682 RepID=UPI00386F5538|nr:hypothetical protein OG584_07625 [Streptomyces sp. NBC_00859]
MAELHLSKTTITTRMVTDWAPAQAAACVIDGGSDQGINAIAVDADDAHIYLVQAKWSPTGTARADETAELKLFADLTLIDAGESRQFNPRGRAMADRAKNLMDSDLTKVTQVINLMGTKKLSPGVRQVIVNGEKDFNHDGTHVYQCTIHSPEIHARARADQRRGPITLDVTLSPWFAFSPSDQQAYQGVAGRAVGDVRQPALRPQHPQPPQPNAHQQRVGGDPN